MAAPRFKKARTQRFLLFLAENTSRANFLQVVGKSVLKAVGIAMLPFLPVNRVVEACANCPPGTGCKQWFLCMIYGEYCGGNACPAGTSQGSSYWVGCCTESTTNCPTHTVRYYDCCTTTGAQCPSGCIQCLNNPTPQPAWCPSGATYVCTIALVQTGSC